MAYAIPIIESLARQTPKLQRSDGCRAVVLVPTREVSAVFFVPMFCFTKFRMHNSLKSQIKN